MSMEKTLTELIAAENEAQRIIDEAEKEAKNIQEQTKIEVQQVIDNAKKEEDQEIEQILAKAREQIQSSRKELLDQAEKEAQHWEELYQKNHDKIVKFIIEAAMSSR